MRSQHSGGCPFEIKLRWLLAGVIAFAILSGTQAHAHEEEPFEAPQLMVPPPPRKVFDPGLPMPSGLRNQLSLMADYRRIIEYYGLLAKTPRSSGHGMGDGPIVKGVEMIDNWERLAGETAARLLRKDTVQTEALQLLDRSFRAARGQLDLEILKHVDHLGIPQVQFDRGNLRSELAIVTLKGLRGQQTAAFVVLACPDEAEGSAELVLVQGEGTGMASASCPLIPGGIIPLSIDFVMGELPEDTRISLTVKNMKSPNVAVRSLVFPVRTESVAPAVLKVRIIDDVTSKQLAARVELLDVTGRFHPPAGARTTKVPEPFGGQQDWNSNYRYPGKDFFYTSGAFETELPPGRTSIRVLRGFEYLEASQNLVLEPGASKEYTIRLKRWIDMPGLGWRAGQTHMHSQHLMPVNDWSDWQLVPEAEGLDISYLSLFQQHEEICTDEYPVGSLPDHSKPDFLLAVGEEFRHLSLGHMTFVGLKEAVQPISTGMLGGKGWPEGPSNGQAIDAAHAQKAVAGYCHINTMRGFISCLELPIDAALGKVDYGEVMGAGGGFKYYYPLLNCGIRMGVTGGPDWRLEDCCRVYVDLGKKKFTERNWLEGLRAQHSFVTNGPMLFLKVNDKGPGTVISGKRGADLHIQAKALSVYPISKIEVLFNGTVIAATEKLVAEGQTSQTILAGSAPSTTSENLHVQAEYAPKTNGWIAARCFGQGNAHTSPVYIEINNEPWESVEDAKLLLGFAEDTLQWAEKRAKFHSDEEKKEIVESYKKGVEFYQRIIDRSGEEAGK